MRIDSSDKVSKIDIIYGTFHSKNKTKCELFVKFFVGFCTQLELHSVKRKKGLSVDMLGGSYLFKTPP